MSFDVSAISCFSLIKTTPPASINSLLAICSSLSAVQLRQGQPPTLRGLGLRMIGFQSLLIEPYHKASIWHEFGKCPRVIARDGQEELLDVVVALSKSRSARSGAATDQGLWDLAPRARKGEMHDQTEPDAPVRCNKD